MQKNHRDPSILFLFLVILLLPGLACSYDAVVGADATPGLDTISKLVTFSGNGASVTSLTYGLYVDAMKTLNCSSAPKVALNIFPDNSLADNNGYPTAGLSKNEYFFTSEVIDPLPTFRPSEADPAVEECVYAEATDLTSIKVNGIYNTNTKAFKPTYISQSLCNVNNVSIYFDDNATMVGDDGVYEIYIRGIIKCPGDQVSYSTSFLLSQSH